MPTKDKTKVIQMISNLRTIIFALAVGLLALAGTSLASSVEHGKPVPAQVTSAKLSADKKSWTVGAKLIKGCRGPDVWWSKAGTYVKFTVEDKNASFTRGQTLKVRWMKYSGMTPKGPVSSTSWQLAP